LPKAGLNGFDWTFVQGSSSVLRLNFCAKNPRLRQYPNRYLQACKKIPLKMKKYFYLLFFVSNLVFSQTHRFFYELKYKFDSLQTEPKKATMVLDINPVEIKYYDNVFLEKEEENKKYNSENTNWTDQIPVVRKKGSNKNTNYEMISWQIYSYPTDDKINWKLSTETKTYQNLSLQKATTNFGGRKWTAWFTNEFPFSEGPYKFQGLPGLIILLQDEKDQYNFSFIQNEKLDKTYDTSNFLEIRYGDKPIPVSEKTINKKKVEYYNDPFNEDRVGLNNGTIKSVDINGVRYTKSSDLIPITKSEQEDIRKHNNPIEVSKAIKYQK